MSCKNSHREDKYLFSYEDEEFFFSYNYNLVEKNFYYNTKRKGQYTGWVEGVVILGSIHGPKLRDIKRSTNPKDP